MKVHKFGGASVKDADSVINLKEILKAETEESLIVISAMGKTTNAIEKILRSYFYDNHDFQNSLRELEDYHLKIAKDLVKNSGHPLFDEIREIIAKIGTQLFELKRAQTTYDFTYDQIVSKGEMLSTRIVSEYLNEVGIKNEWVDAERLIVTDKKYRNASVIWKDSGELVKKCWENRKASLVISQGFVGGTKDGFTTTLGREGSDFSAAIFANLLDANSVTIWKDVPGILNADPKYFNNPEKLSQISYHEAVELAYYGATVMHPKTIKPLENKNIPLYVKSFKDSKEEGTVIDNNISKDKLIPSFIFMSNQVLISISPRDYSFIMEDNLSHIFGLLAKFGIRINLMQNSAISFSVCVAYDKSLIEELIKELNNSYKVLYNKDLELLTVRHYNQKTIDYLTEGKDILVIQKSRHTARIVMRDHH